MIALPRLTIDRGTAFSDEHGNANGHGLTLYWGRYVFFIAGYRR